MGVSFKVAKTGKRYRPRLMQVENSDAETSAVVTDETFQPNNVGNSEVPRSEVTGYRNELTKCEVSSLSEELEVSFSLNLFANGFSVGEATEVFHDIPKQLHSYDRASETLFSAIEHGSLPGDIVSDIPFKYVKGVLLCEIRDYRHCLFQKTGNAVTEEDSPTVHRVLLQMCMENVVKDITSISDDSWTYEDQLEVESRILKVLQPNLHLDPEPLLDRGCVTPLRKLSLGISWSWKKRKLYNASTINFEFSKKDNIHQNPDTEVKHLQPPSSIPTSRERNVVPEIIPQTHPSTPDSNFQMEDSCNRSLVAKPYGLSVLRERGICENKAIEVPCLKKPKQEVIEFSQQPPWGIQAETVLAHTVERRKNPPHLRAMAEQVLSERFEDKNQHSASINNVCLAKFEGTGKLRAGIYPYTPKQEPAETSSFAKSEIMNLNDKYHTSGQYNFQQPLPTPSQSRKNPAAKRGNQNLRNETVTQTRKALKNPQVMSGARIACVSPYYKGPSPETAALEKQETNSGSREKVVDLRYGTIYVNARSNVPQSGNIPLSQVSESKGDPILNRFLKIEGVTQRYGLINMKRKLDMLTRKTPFFPTTSLVALHLLDSNNDMALKDAITDRVPLSRCFLDRTIYLFKTRTLSFLSQYLVQRGNVNPMIVREIQIKLVMTENINDKMVKASFLYGHEDGIDMIIYPLPAFPSTHRADLFATQFTSLVVREGYYLDSDHIEPHSLEPDGNYSSQQPCDMSSVTLSAKTVEQVSPKPFPCYSPFMPSPNGNTSSINSRQFPSPNLLLGYHMFNHGNIHSTQNLQASNLSLSQLEYAAQFSYVHPQWQQILSKDIHNQLQMQQRQKQEQFLQREQMMRRLGRASGKLGMAQSVHGIHGFGHIGLDPLGNIMDMRSSMPVSTGHVPWIGNLSQLNGCGCNVVSLNESNQSSSGFLHCAVANLMKLRSAEGHEIRQRSLISGVSIPRSNVVLHMPNIVDVDFNINKKLQPFQTLLSQQQQQLKIRSPQQALDMCNFAEVVSSLPSQANAQNLLSAKSPWQLISGSPFQQIDTGSFASGAESSEPSSRTHGSAGSNNAGNEII